MNEGCATFVHHYIVNTLHDKGLITDGALLEILHSHTNVVRQPEFDDPHYQGINPYALGFAMMSDIKRICCEPEDEDREWFPDIAGNGDWRGTLKDAWANYRDESFIRQFLSPHLIRALRLFVLCNESSEDHYTVGKIHDERGYQNVRETLAGLYDVALMEPDIQVVDVDLRGDRVLHLRHTMRDGVRLHEAATNEVLAHVRRLWGYDVSLAGVDAQSGDPRYHLASSANPAAPTEA
jgi:stage V sporulation protein R